MIPSGLGGLVPPFSCVLLLSMLSFEARFARKIRVRMGKISRRESEKLHRRTTPHLRKFVKGEAVSVDLVDWSSLDDFFQMIRAYSEATGFYVSQSTEVENTFLYEPKITAINGYDTASVLRAIHHV